MCDDEVWRIIKDMVNKTMSASRTSGWIGIDKRTVRMYMNSDKVPKQSHRKRKSNPDPAKPIIKELIDKYNLSAIRILEEGKGLQRLNKNTQGLLQNFQRGNIH